MRKARDPKTNQEFAQRLNYLLQQKGFSSGHAKNRVRSKELAQAAGCSAQMAYCYINGLAMPDPDTLKRIAQWLEVSPGWLFCGETVTGQSNQTLLSQEIVIYLLEKALPLYAGNKAPEATRFLTDLLTDLSSLATDEAILKRYIDAVIKAIASFERDPTI